MQVAAEGAYIVHDGFVAPHQPVVGEHSGHGHGQADGSHEQGFTDRACHFVDGGLAGDADGGEGVVDAPNGPEETDEGGYGTDGGEEGQAVLGAALDALNGAVDAGGDPFVEVNVAHQ